MTVPKASYSSQRTEVVVERAILLHQDDDVLHIGDCAARVRCGKRQRATYARRKDRERCGTSGCTRRELQKAPAVLINHLASSLFCFSVDVAPSG